MGASVLALALVVAGPSATLADPRPSVAPHHVAGHDLPTHDGPEVAGSGELALTAALRIVLSAIGVWGVAIVARRWRRAAATALVLLLGGLALETGAHAVHHLADPEKAARCSASWASQHVEGAGESLPDVALRAVALGAPAPPRMNGQPPTPMFILPEGRAPPRPSPA